VSSLHAGSMNWHQCRERINVLAAAATSVDYPEGGSGEAILSNAATWRRKISSVASTVPVYKLQECFSGLTADKPEYAAK
jgi:hypothetical protein